MTSVKKPDRSPSIAGAPSVQALPSFFQSNFSAVKSLPQVLAQH